MNDKTADQTDAKVSPAVLVDMTGTVMSIRIAVKANTEYHHPAINFLDDPPHNASARVVV